MKKIFFIAGLSMLLGFTAKAQQDAQFSQYMFNGIYINPAYAGYREQLNVHSFYRSQWTGVPGAPRTFSMAVDAVANDGNVGLAFQAFSDKLGAQNNLSAYGSYAYRIRMNADGSARLALGLSAGLIQNGINYAALTTNDQESELPAGTQNTISPDARAGIFYSDNKFYAGVSFDNLIVQYMSKNHFAYVPQTKLHYYVTAGMLVPIDENVQLKPSFLLKDDLGGPTSLDLNSFLLYKEIIWLGGSYRTRVNLYDKSYLQKTLSYRNSIVALIELFPVKNLRVGYAYDFAIGALQGYASGTHEISVGFSFNKQNVRMATPRVF